jgi:hypothetical protein
MGGLSPKKRNLNFYKALLNFFKNKWCFDGEYTLEIDAK